MYLTISKRFEFCSSLRLARPDWTDRRNREVFGDEVGGVHGYGRNFLIPQGLAVMATPGSMKQAERIRTSANELRVRLNQELGAVAEKLNGLTLAFPVKAGETGKLYGSITTAQLAEAIETETGAQIDRRQIDIQPIKLLGVHSAAVRLTIDLVPEITILVHRDSEPAESAYGEDVEDTDISAQIVEELEEQEALEAEAEADEEDADLDEIDVEEEPAGEDED